MSHATALGFVIHRVSSSTSIRIALSAGSSVTISKLMRAVALSDVAVIVGKPIAIRGAMLYPTPPVSISMRNSEPSVSRIATAVAPEPVVSSG